MKLFLDQKAKKEKCSVGERIQTRSLSPSARALTPPTAGAKTNRPITSEHIRVSNELTNQNRLCRWREGEKSARLNFLTQINALTLPSALDSEQLRAVVDE